MSEESRLRTRSLVGVGPGRAPDGPFRPRASASLGGAGPCPYESSGRPGQSDPSAGAGGGEGGPSPRSSSPVKSEETLGERASTGRGGRAGHPGRHI